jgi:ERCC4-type nuclease
MFKGQYKYTEKELKALLKSIVILVDTKEKVNEHLIKWFDDNKIAHEKKSLGHGDYSFFLPKCEELGILRDIYFVDEISVERKNSADELVGNFSADRNRIEDEFLRHKGKMTLVIETSAYKDIKEGNYRSTYLSKSAIGTLHSFSEKYNVDFIFLDKEYTACYIYCKFYYYLKSLFLK